MAHVEHHGSVRHNEAEEHEYHHPPAPFKLYLKVFGALCVLTFITVVAARFDFGFLNTAIAMLIATIKASLVLAIFMHLKDDTKLNKLIFAHAFIFLILLWAFSYFDIITRIKGIE